MKTRMQTMVLMVATMVVGSDGQKLAGAIKDSPVAMHTIYYDKPYKTGSSSIRAFLDSEARHNGWVTDNTLCDHDCAGLRNSDMLTQDNTTVTVSLNHKAWHWEAGTGVAWRDHGIYTVTSVRDPVDRYMSWYREVAWQMDKTANTSEVVSRGITLARFALTSHNPYSLHDFYSRGRGTWGDAEEAVIVGRYRCILELDRPEYGLQLLVRGLEAAGCRVHSEWDLHRNVRKSEEETKHRYANDFGRLKELLAPEYRLFYKLRAASESEGNCRFPGALCTRTATQSTKCDRGVCE